MKTIVFSCFVALSLALVHSSRANVINVLGSGDFPAQDISSITGKSGLGDDNVLAWLLAEIQLNQFPVNILTSSAYDGGPVNKGDYLVLRYGSGSNGGSSGGLVALYFDADQASFAVPQGGAGPNGNGELSFARLFDPPSANGPSATVPDAGGTLGLLILAVAGLASLVQLHKGSKRFTGRLRTYTRSRG